MIHIIAIVNLRTHHYFGQFLDRDLRNFSDIGRTRTDFFLKLAPLLFTSGYLRPGSVRPGRGGAAAVHVGDAVPAGPLGAAAGEGQCHAEGRPPGPPAGAEDGGLDGQPPGREDLPGGVPGSALPDRLAGR